MAIIIDKEKIEKAANELCDYGSVYNSGYRIDGFKKGAKWAIQEINKILLRHDNKQSI